MQLNNGAEILRIKVSRDVLFTDERKNVFVGTVLGYRPDSQDAFVTWTVSSQDGGVTFDAFNGHYFDSFNRASQDFDDRSWPSNVIRRETEPTF